MKVAIIADIHWNIGSSGSGKGDFFLDYQLDYFTQQVFPALKERGITFLLCCGDFFHNRAFVSSKVFHKVKNVFLKGLRDNEINFVTIVGNHDLYYTDSSEITSLSVLEECERVSIIRKPKVLNFDGFNIGMVPWISNEEEQAEFEKFVKNCNASIIVSHLELKGFEFASGIISEKGQDEELLLGFDKVLNGHYHGKQIKQNSNIMILGTPYELDWGDYGKDKGFYVLDTVTRGLEFIPNTKKIHVKVEYDETKTEELNAEIKNLKDKIVKVVVKNKTDDVKFSAFIYQVENAGVINSTVIDTPEQESDFEIDMEKSQTILEVINEYINVTYAEDKAKLYTKIMEKIYEETQKEKSAGL